MKKLIVTGTYRSGTTLTQKILDMNPAVDIIPHGMLPYFKLVESIFFIKQGYPFKDRPLCLEYLEPDEPYRNLFEDVELNHEDIATLLKGIEADIQNDLKLGGGKTKPAIEWLDKLKKTVGQGKAKDVFHQMCKAIPLYRQKEQAVYVGIKEINLEQFSEPLFRTFGKNLQIIHLIRDPRAVLASRNFGGYLHTKGGGRMHSILLVARMWRTSVRYKWYLSSHYPDHFISLRYEDLVVNPEREIRRICDFLNIAFIPNMMETRLYKNEEGKDWSPNTSFKNKNGFFTSSIRQWEKVLPEAELGVLEYLCRNEMIAEGYKPVFGEEKSLETLVHYQEDTNRLKPWIFKYDLLLDLKQKQREVARHYALEYSA